MRTRILMLLPALATIAACGDNIGTEPAPADVAPTVVAEVLAADEIGAFEAAITDLAFWAHPTIPFNGLAIASTANGLVTFNIEDGVEVSRVNGIEASGVAVSYVGVGETAEGYAAVSVADGNKKSIAFYAVDNATRALKSVSSLLIPGTGDDAGFCLGRHENENQVVVHQMRAGGWSSRAVTIAGETTSEEREKFVRFRGGFVVCVADDVDRSVIAVNAKGDIHRLNANGSIDETPLAKSGVKNPTGVGLALSGLVEGGPTSECCGHIFILDGADATVHVFDRDDGRAVGVIRLAASFDIDGVEIATAMGVGAGNFGAIYRDGVIALATNGASPVMRLAPLNAVMDALSEPLGPAAGPRDLGRQEDDEIGLEIDVPGPAKQ